MSAVTGAEAPDANADFSSLFEFLPIGAYRSTPGGRLLRANPAAARLNGCSSVAELMSLAPNIEADWYVQPGRRAEFKIRLEQDRQVIGFESEAHRLKTRERIWVRENAHVVHDAEGRALFYEGTVEEVTEHVLHREALRRSQVQLRQIVDLVPGVIYRVVTGPGELRRVGFISPNVMQLFGVSPEAVARDPVALRHLRHPADRERVDAEIQAAFVQQRALDIEFRIVLADGRERWIHQTNTVAPPEQRLVEAGAGKHRRRRLGLEPAKRRKDPVAGLPGPVRLRRRRTATSDHRSGRTDPPRRPRHAGPVAASAPGRAGTGLRQ